MLAIATRALQRFCDAADGNDEDMTDHDRQIEKDREELKDLQREIDDVRAKADPAKKDEPRYVDSGTLGEEYDDQSITPPG